MTKEDDQGSQSEQTAPEIALQSWVPITPSFVRMTIQEYTGRAYEEWYTGWREGAMERSNAYFDRIGNIATIQIVESRSVENDYNYRCAEYVFHTRRGETWALEDNQGEGREFWADSHQFLLSHGYSLIDLPQPGDIIAYGRLDRTNPDIKRGYYQHFGIYEGDGRVTSKFDMGHVFNHPWALVPLQYGDTVAFFRKSPQPKQ
ncbi:MAG TPA: hypothetical protein VG917_01755 [Patescibacteria group bacterium]|nr:hypothetical protein [Patescibacteria group bacterium]